MRGFEDLLKAFLEKLIRNRFLTFIGEYERMIRYIIQQQIQGTWYDIGFARVFFRTAKSELFLRDTKLNSFHIVQRENKNPSTDKVVYVPKS